MHPLFAGFDGFSLYAVGQALGFAVHAESALGPLPAELPTHQSSRQLPGGDLAGFYYAGGWEAPGAHCMLFVKPVTALALACWAAGSDQGVQGAASSALKACPYCSGPPSVSVGAYPSGAAAELDDYGDDGLSVEAVVFCHECGAQGPEVEDVVFDRAGYQAVRARAVSQWQARDARHAPLYVASLKPALSAPPSIPR